MAEFKPNIYPIMYWAIAFGAVAGVLLFLLNVLSAFITVVWFPVFLVAAAWGAYRNYKKQKGDFNSQQGTPRGPGSPVQEIRSAVSDIASASQELIQSEDEEALEAAPQEEAPVYEEVDEQPFDQAQGKPPQTPPAPPA